MEHNKEKLTSNREILVISEHQSESRTSASGTVPAYV